MSDKIYIGQVIEALGIKEWIMRGEPTNETEFNSMFKKITGLTEDDSAIESSDPNDFGITWDQITSKKTEMENAVTQKATDKASAINKLEALGLTADEISALTGS